MSISEPSGFGKLAKRIRRLDSHIHLNFLPLLLKYLNKNILLRVARVAKLGKRSHAASWGDHPEFYMHATRKGTNVRSDPMPVNKDGVKKIIFGGVTM